MKARIPNAPSQGNMMKQIQKMQEDMQNTQAEIENTEFTTSSGGGAVEVTVNGSHEVKSIHIKPEVVDPDDIEMLQDLIVAATNEALKQAEDANNEMMGKMTGGFGGFPF